jgi:hypothetical protein
MIVGSSQLQISKIALPPSRVHARDLSHAKAVKLPASAIERELALEE